MAEDITQKLGFDASGAIQELVRLRQELQNFKQSIQNVSGSLRKFPAAASPAIKTFRELGLAATSASTAIQSLAVAGGAKQAGAAVTSSFGPAKVALQGAARAATQLAAAFTAASAQIAQSARTAGAALTGVGTASAQASTTTAISWKTIARVVQAQIIVRAVSTLIAAFKEAREAAIQFSVAVAEAFTISGGALGSMDQMNEGVRQLALSLGETGAIVAEGVYQTLSNQVVEAGDALKFTEQAGRLAIATQSSMKDAVNALSSVMNSYGLDVAEVTEVSDVLFKTVELGRTRLNEFGATLGRLAPLTAKLGISYQEMAAGIAAITKKGVPTHTALTQLLQVSQKLLRPTEKLQELYKEWGVSTGREAIERFGGLRGVLLKMKDATAGNDTEFANLLGRVRSIVGGFNLVTNSAEDLTFGFEAMTNVAGETVTAMNQIRESTGREAIEAWNNLGTEMLTVGKILAEITTPFAKGLQVIVRNMKSVTDAALAVGVAFLVVKAKAILAAVEMGIMAVAAKGLLGSLAALGPVALIALSIFAAVKIGEVWRDWADTATKSAERIANAARSLTAEHDRATKARIDATKAEFADQNKFAGQFFTEMSKMYQKDVGAFETRNEIIGKVFENTLGNLMKKRAEAIKIIKDAVLEADDAIKSSAEKQATAQGKLDDLSFKQELRRLSKRRAASAIHQRAEKAAARAAQAFARAGANEEAQIAARKLSQLAEVRAKEDISHQKSMDNLNGVKAGEKVLEGILKTQIRSEQSFQDSRTQQRDKAHKEELARIEEAAVAVKVLADRFKELADPSGKTFERMAKDAELLAEIIPQLADEIKTAFDFDAFKELGLPEGINQLKVGVMAAFQDARFDWVGSVAGLKNVLTSQKYEIPVKVVITNKGFIEKRLKAYGETDLIGDPGKLASQNLKTAQDIQRTFEAAEQSASQALDNLQEHAATIRTIPTAENLLNTSFFGPDQKGDETLKQFRRRFNDGEKIVEALRQKMISLGNTMEQQALTGKGVTDEINTGLEEIRTTAVKLGETHFISPDGVGHIRNMFEQLQKARTELELYNTAAQTSKGIPVGSYEQSLDVLRELSVEAKKQVLTEELFGTKKSKTNTALKRSVEVQKILNQSAKDGVTALDNEIEAVDALATAYGDAADAAERRWEITRQPDVAGQPGVVDPPVDTSADVLIAQAEAARQLKEELVLVNTEFATVISSAGSLTTAVSAPLEPAKQLRDVFVNISQVMTDVNAAIPLMASHLTVATSNAGALTAALKQSATAVNTITTAFGSMTNSIMTAAGAGISMAASMNKAASAAIRAAQACAAAAKQCAGGGIRASAGGQFFAHGGRGTDTISAMLTPGEFVVNAKSARNFFPQLQAINAGQNPVFREQGGQVTNIGDVNVTVESGETPTQTVREIANGLRRELRRKTVRLY